MNERANVVYSVRGNPCSTQPCPLRHLHDHQGFGDADIMALVIADFRPPASMVTKDGAVNLCNLVADDVVTRQEKGRAKYGDTLRLNTAIDPLRYEYEELVDAMVYARLGYERARGTTHEARMRDKYNRRAEEVIEVRRELFERDGC